MHADRPGPWRVAELQGAGRRGEHDAVGVLGRLDVGAGADAERRPEVDDEHCGDRVIAVCGATTRAVVQGRDAVDAQAQSSANGGRLLRDLASGSGVVAAANRRVRPGAGSWTETLAS